MSAVVHALLEYADNHLSPELLRASGYWEEGQRLSTLWKEFEKDLSPEQCRHLKALLEQETGYFAKDAEAAFQSGLSIGLELGRL